MQVLEFVQAPGLVCDLLFPFLNITQQFTYNSSSCTSPDAIVLAPRPDPSNSLCKNLNVDDAVLNAQNYSSDQLHCLMYLDNTLDITACKNGNCKTHNFTPTSLVSGPRASVYENVCDAFTQGNGVYSVTIKAYDDGGSLNQGGIMYGSSSFYLTWLSYNNYTITGNIYNDYNKNHIKDATDTSYPASGISISPNAGTITTNTNGTYSITGLPNGTYTVS